MSTEHRGFEHFNKMAMESLIEKMSIDKRYEEDTGQTISIVMLNNKEAVIPEIE